MENDSRSSVRISLTRPSISVDPDSDDGLGYLRQLDKSGRPRTPSNTSDNMDSEIDRIVEGSDDEKGQLDEEDKEIREINGGEQTASSQNEDETLSQALQNGVTLSANSEEVNREESSKTSSEQGSKSRCKSPAIEMVGDRVLIERDGKFELVDASEIKAEYFEMLGLSPEQKESSVNDVGKASDLSEDKPSAALPKKQEISGEKHSTNRARPKTTGLERISARNPTSPRRKSPNRTQSAKPLRRSDEYSYIKSRYAMTEQQLEMKRKREEAIARRRKEEEARELEEQRRKRDDAESAFQAWLFAKNQEAKEQRLEAEKNKPDPNIPVERAKNAQSAFNEWLRTKQKQSKTERELEKSRIEEEASQFLIRDRELCDEAFKRWVRKKCADARAKAAAKKKRKPRKLKKKEALPVNSEKIRFCEYYGYRNTPVLTP